MSREWRLGAELEAASPEEGKNDCSCVNGGSGEVSINTEPEMIRYSKSPRSAVPTLSFLRNCLSTRRFSLSSLGLAIGLQ